MTGSLSSQIEDVLPRTSDAYYRLILAVGPARLGKTVALAEIAARHNCTVGFGLHPTETFRNTVFLHVFQR